MQKVIDDDTDCKATGMTGYLKRHTRHSTYVHKEKSKMNCQKQVIRKYMKLMVILFIQPNARYCGHVNLTSDLT